MEIDLFIYLLDLLNAFINPSILSLQVFNNYTIPAYIILILFFTTLLILGSIYDENWSQLKKFGIIIFIIGALFFIFIGCILEKIRFEILQWLLLVISIVACVFKALGGGFFIFFIFAAFSRKPLITTLGFFLSLFLVYIILFISSGASLVLLLFKVIIALISGLSLFIYHIHNTDWEDRRPVLFGALSIMIFLGNLYGISEIFPGVINWFLSSILFLLDHIYFISFSLLAVFFIIGFIIQLMQKPGYTIPIKIFMSLYVLPLFLLLSLIIASYLYTQFFSGNTAIAYNKKQSYFNKELTDTWNNYSFNHNYEGQVNEKGLADGKGTITFTGGKYKGDTYTGEWKDGERNGQGIYTWHDGDTYAGKWKEGKMHGQGTFSRGNGDIYVGEWKNGKKHGYGTYSWISGDNYAGEWKDSIIHGRGTYTWKNGNSYTGDWKNGKKHGQGIYTWKNGKKFTGEFRNDTNTRGWLEDRDGNKKWVEYD